MAAMHGTTRSRIRQRTLEFETHARLMRYENLIATSRRAKRRGCDSESYCKSDENVRDPKPCGGAMTIRRALCVIVAATGPLVR